MLLTEVMILVKRKIIIFFLAALFLIQCSCIITANPANALTLSAPRVFRVQVYQDQNVLYWSNNDSEPFLYTVIERATDQGDFYPIAYMNKSLDTFTDRSVSNGHVYRYRARTITANEMSPYTPVVEAVMLFPVSLRIADVFVGQIDLEWSYPDLPLQRTPDYYTVIERREYSSSAWKTIATLPVTETTYRDTDISTNGHYFYRIRMQYAAGRYSRYYPSDSGINARAAFPLNTPLWGYGLSDGKIRLEWDTSMAEGGIAYIERQTDSGEYITIANTFLGYFIDAATERGKTYTYRLRMRSPVGIDSDYTEEISITAEQVSVPADLTALAYDGEKIALSWYYPYDDETGFEIWRKAEKGKWEKLGTASKNTDAYHDYTAINGVRYTYRVRAVRGNNAFSGFTPDVSVVNMFPANPGEIVCVVNQGMLFIYSGNIAPENTVYSLEYRRSINSEWIRLISVSDRPLSARINVKDAAGCFFRIKASIGGLETAGPEMYFFGSAPEAPRNLQVQHVGYDRVTMTWEDVTDKEDGYYIYRTVKNANGTAIRTLIGSAGKDAQIYTDNSPAAGSQVYYEAVAYNISGESLSAGVSVRIPAKVSYKDIAQYQWAYDSIYTLQGLGAFEDAPNGLFNPQSVVTRGQLARMIIKSFNIPYQSPDILPPADITPYHPYYKDMITAVKTGLLHPDVNGNVSPDKVVTRREVLIMLNSALGYAGLSLNQYETNILERFSDYYLTAPEEANIIASFAGDNIITGKSGQQLSLNTYATKVEAVAFIYRTLVRYKLVK
jgi:hypothetical protein